MPRDTSALRRSAQERSEETRARVAQAIRVMDRRGDEINFVTVAERAGVSRQWLYTQADFRKEIESLRAQTGDLSAVPSSQRASEQSIRARLAVALDDNRRLREEVAQLKQELAVALGQHRTARRTHE